MKNPTSMLYVIFLLAPLLGMTGCGGGSSPDVANEPSLPTIDVAIITTLPPSSSNSATATFAFANSSGSEKFEVKLDGGSFVAIENKSFTTPPLADGKHVVSVRPLGATAVSGQGVATYEWTIDSSPPVLSIRFPSSRSLTPLQTVNIYGSVNDADAESVVTVNGKPVLKMETQGEWMATVDLTNGDNTVDVMSVDSVGNESKKILHVRREPLLVRPNGLIMDAVQDSLTTLDYYTGALYQFDLQNRRLNVLSDKARGRGALFHQQMYPVLDKARNRILAMSNFSGTLIAFDLMSGDRTVVSSGEVGEGPTLGVVSGLAVDEVSNEILVIGGNSPAILAVDPLSGNRRVLVDLTDNNGPSIAGVDMLAFDQSNRKLYIASRWSMSSGIVKVDLDTGLRNIVASNETENGRIFDGARAMTLDASKSAIYLASNENPGDNTLVKIDIATGTITRLLIPVESKHAPLTRITGLQHDSAKNRLLATDSNLDSFVAIDLDSGARTLLMDNHVGSGKKLLGPREIIGPVDGKSQFVLFDKVSTGVGESLTNVVMADLAEQTLAESGAEILNLDSRLTPIAYSPERNLIHFWSSWPNGKGIATFDVASRTVNVVKYSGELAEIFNNPKGFAVDSIGKVAYMGAMIPQQDNTFKAAVFAVDMDNGGVKLVAENGLGTGPTFSYIASLAFSKSRNEILIADLFSDQWIGINPVTGDRRIVATSSANEVFSPVFSYVPTNSDVMITLSHSFRWDKLQSVDLGTGKITTIASNEKGRGSPFFSMDSVATNVSGDTAYIADSELGGVWQVDMKTGDRVVVLR